MNYRADIVSISAGAVTIAADEEMLRAIQRTGAAQLDLRPLDPRCHSREQHGKVFALCREIARHWGYLPEEMRGILQDKFCEDEWLEPFSMQDADMSLCSRFIKFLINHCLEYGVQTKYPLGQYADDLEKYIYACLYYKKCAICGRDGETHHVDAIQMGHDRDEADHLGRRAICLCRTHHTQAHQMGVNTFFEMHHLPRGIKLDEYLCKKLKLKAGHTL